MAMGNLGACYAKGDGVPKDLTKAAEWFWKAAQTGDASGMYNIGICYYHGQGVKQDRDLSMQWLKKSAALGCAEAKQQIAAIEGGRNLALGILVAVMTSNPGSGSTQDERFSQDRWRERRNADEREKEDNARREANDQKLNEQWKRLTTPD